MSRSRLARIQVARSRNGRLRGCTKTLLTRDQERAVRAAWRSGATRDQAARAAGVSVGLIRQRLADQLADLPRPGRGRPGRPRIQQSDPTPEEIYGALTAEIQARWTDEERDSKWHGRPE